MADYTPADFATTLLRRLKIKPTPGALQALEGWQAAEGGHWKNQARYNPLNTTQNMPGAGNTGSQGNIKVYQNWNQGIDATVKTLNNGRYGGIIAALQKGDPSAFVQAVGASPWGTSADLIKRTVLGTKGATGSVIPGSTQAPDATRVSSIASTTPVVPGATQATPQQPSVYDVIAQYRNATQQIRSTPIYKQPQTQAPGAPTQIGLAQPYDPQVAAQQIQDEVQRIIAARNLPTAGGGAGTTFAAASTDGGGGGGGGAQSALQWAESKVGTRESGGANRGQLPDYLNQRFGFGASGGQPWCAMFTSAAVTKGGAPASARTASVAQLRQKAQAGQGYVRGFIPAGQARPGDLVLFGDRHVGLVKGVDQGGKIRYVGGNQSDAVTEATTNVGAGISIVRPKYGARR